MFYVPASVPPHTTLIGCAQITSTSEDQNPSNDRDSDYETVVTSWDPNDKDAQPWGSEPDHYVLPDQPLKYTIFFENDTSATAEAIYIDIVDSLDTNLDWQTLEIGPMSHPDTCEASFDTNSGVLIWHCDSIMLPPNDNPPEGEGFVAFSVKPDSGLPVGFQIKNRAYIQFDFNPWVAAPESGPVVRTIGIYGDSNGDGEIEVGDVVILISYLFRNGLPPNPFLAGDATCDGDVSVDDVVYLISYLFRNGPPPEC
jgi:hypothetical protein